jgi:hypothetical protein
MKKKNYYRLYVMPSTKIRPRGGMHIIKAFSEEDALRIRKKFGISHPWGVKGIKTMNCKRLDMRFDYAKSMIKRRIQGFGGNIWYEDENGQLQTEK